METYIVTATQHISSNENIVTPFNILKSDNNHITFNLLGRLFTRYDALAKLEEFFVKKYDAVFNENDNCYYINEEKVYHIGDTIAYVNGVKYEVTDHWEIQNRIFEYCNECGNEEILVNYFAPQRCECGEILMPCCLCEICIKNCPLMGLKKYMEETNIEIVFDNKCLRVDGTYLTPITKIDKAKQRLIGRKVFWLDPRFLCMEYHTSAWKTIADIKGNIVIFDCGTEVYMNECYI